MAQGLPSMYVCMSPFRYCTCNTDPSKNEQKLQFQKIPPGKYQGEPRCGEGVLFSRPPLYPFAVELMSIGCF